MSVSRRHHNNLQYALALKDVSSDWEYILLIAHNLYKALSHYRNENVAKFMWVDSLCAWSIRC